MSLDLPLRSLRRLLGTVIAVLAIAGVASEAHWFASGTEDAEDLMRALSLSEEHNVPTWWSALLHLTSGLLLALVAREARRSGAPHPRRWTFLSLLFLYISLDETVMLHEGLNRVIQGGRGAFYFDWIIPASGILLALGVVYLPFVLDLPRRTRRDFVRAGAVFVGGALLMEVPLGLWTDANGSSNMGYVLIDAVEEVLEMIGASMFLVAVLRHLAGETGRVVVDVVDDVAAEVPPRDDGPTGDDGPQRGGRVLEIVRTGMSQGIVHSLADFRRARDD